MFSNILIFSTSCPQYYFVGYVGNTLGKKKEGKGRKEEERRREGKEVGKGREGREVMKEKRRGREDKKGARKEKIYMEPVESCQL